MARGPRPVPPSPAGPRAITPNGGSDVEREDEKVKANEEKGAEGSAQEKEEKEKETEKEREKEAETGAETGTETETETETERLRAWEHCPAFVYAHRNAQSTR